MHVPLYYKLGQNTWLSGNRMIKMTSHMDIFRLFDFSPWES